MKLENDTNKQLKAQQKEQMRELDVKLAKDYVTMVDRQEQKQREALQARVDRVNDFMHRMEQGALAEDNRKAQMITDNIQKYTEKQELADRRDQDRRKRQQEHNRVEIFNSLNMQMSEKQLKKTAFKSINDDFMHQWNVKVKEDIAKEEAEK